MLELSEGGAIFYGESSKSSSRKAFVADECFVVSNVAKFAMSLSLVGYIKSPLYDLTAPLVLDSDTHHPFRL